MSTVSGVDFRKKNKPLLVIKSYIPSIHDMAENKKVTGVIPHRN